MMGLSVTNLKIHTTSETIKINMNYRTQWWYMKARTTAFNGAQMERSTDGKQLGVV